MTVEKKRIFSSCASCTVEIPERICFSDKGKGHKGWPSLTRKDVLEVANKEYEAKEINACLQGIFTGGRMLCQPGSAALYHAADQNTDR